jgi:methyl-accepting chemotaxis protein
VSVNNLAISRKLALAFAAVVAIIVTMSAVIFWNIAQIEKAAGAEAEAGHAVDIIAGAEFRLARQENSYRGFLLTNSPYYIERLESHRAAFDNHLAALAQARAGHADEAAVRAGIADVGAKMDRWQHEIVDEGRRLAADPIFRFKALEVVGQDGNADALMEPIEDALSALAESERGKAAAAAAEREAVTTLTETALFVGVGLAVLLAGVLGYLLSRMIATPVTALTGVMGRLAAGDHSVAVPAVGRGDEIGEMARAVLVFKEAAIEKIRLEAETTEARSAAEGERNRNEAEKARDAADDQAVVAALGSGLSALAAGDLTYRISASFPARTQKLKEDFNATAAQLQDTMAMIAEAIGGMRSGTGEISQAADDLSRRTEQQAASLEETAAALDQITATVSKTAESAHQASEVTGQARTGAEKSGDVVRRAVEAMAQIEKSSQQIGQIIGVIDEIAFQTNLLALNAGVEAARAGEAGRGFAVVAQEVRALAQRSAEAAREIKELISTSTRQVGEGVDLVGETGQALERIVGQVGQISGLVSEIAASAREQSTGLAEVNSAVNQMDQVTQQNAAMVEQSTAASHGLAHEARELAQLVAKFRLGTEAAAQRPVAAAPARHEARPQPRPAMQAAPARTIGNAAAALLAAQPAEEGWEEF